MFILNLRRFIYSQSQDLEAYLSEKLKKLRQPIKSKDLPKKGTAEAFNITLRTIQKQTKFISLIIVKYKKSRFFVELWFSLN